MGIIDYSLRRRIAALEAGGMPVVRKFPFDHTTPGLLTGDANLYVPTIGDILLDAWVVIETAFNGSPLPQLNIGRWNLDFESPNGGFWRWFISPTGISIDANSPDEIGDFDFGIGSQKVTGATAVSDLVGMASYGIIVQPQPTNFSARWFPARFVTAEPVAAVVTTNGHPTNDSPTPGANPHCTQGAATLYLMTARPV